MFSRAASVFVLALPLLAAATAVPRGGSPPPSQCTNGSVQCCNSVESTSDPLVATLLGLLGINLGSVTGLVGITCALAVTTCSQQAVCCTNTSFNGLIALGCNEISL